ncbi:MAG: hypothetical protein M3O26_05925 [Pseudomonadota bacterium]|nr:hypothetical protein [Pseudomonadota bacterium]
MRIRRKIEITPRGGGSFWPICLPIALALCLMPEVASAGIAHALATAELPAVLLSFGLLSAVIERNK